MDKNLIDGLTLIGIALTATGLFANASGWGKWVLLISALILGILGLAEIYKSMNKK
jgi:hypothetical protein